MNVARGVVVDPAQIFKNRSHCHPTLNLVRWLAYIIKGFATLQINFQYISSSP